MHAPCSTRKRTIARLLQEAAQCNGVLWTRQHSNPQEEHAALVRKIYCYEASVSNLQKSAMSYPNWILPTPSHPSLPQSILILSIHLNQGLQSGLFLWGLPSEILDGFLMCVTCLGHLILLYLISHTMLGEVPHQVKFLTLLLLLLS